MAGDVALGAAPGARLDIRPAQSGDLPEIRALLRASGLPLDGADSPQAELFVLEHGGHLAGVVGLESYPPYALLRSLAVAPELRGQGRGRELFDFVLRRTRERGFTAVYGLTTTIPDWLSRLGFRELPQRELPDELTASAELQGACPATARAFVMEL